MPLWELALQALWAYTLTTLLLKLQTYPQIKTPLHFYGTFGLLPFISLFLSHLLTPMTRTLPPYSQHRSTPLIIKILLMCLISNAEEAEVEWFYEDLQDLIEQTSKKRCPFHYRGLECKSRKSGNTWSNRQIWPWSTEGSRAKANRVLSREHTGHSKHLLPKIQEKTLYMDITRWSILKSD